MAKASTDRKAQPLPIRATHWINLVALLMMAGSGLQILAAYPYLGPRGDLAGWWPWQGQKAPHWMRLGDWLAGARHLHFAFAWLLALNALGYLAYYFASGEWRRRAFRPLRDARLAVQQAARYLRLRKDPAPPGLYNGLQKFGYTSALVLGLVEVLSGLALYKPVQLAWLAWIFGGYDGARAVHLLALIALGLFTIGHVLMVLLHPRTFVEMVTGGRAK